MICSNGGKKNIKRSCYKVDKLIMTNLIKMKIRFDVSKKLRLIGHMLDDMLDYVIIDFIIIMF